MVRFRISVSLDGFVAGPNQSVDNPLGVGGFDLHQWVFPLAAWRAMQGLDGGETNTSNTLIEDQNAGVGATIMGRNMFGGGPGPWAKDTPWNGWWGAEPPFRHPVFVLTHHERAPMKLGSTTFTFVTEGPKKALELAQVAAGAKDVLVAGGAHVANEFLREGLVDQMDLSVVPVLLGSGARLFDNVGTNMHGLKLYEAIPAAGVTHLRFKR